MKVKLFETLNSVLEMQITESQDDLLHLEGIFGVCGVLNNNNRIYTKENYAQMIDQIQDKIANHSLLGEMEHSMSLTTRLENVSHRIDSVSIDEDGVVHGSLTILKTPKGQIAEAIIRSGSPLYVSSKAIGSIDENNVVTLTQLFGWDLVGSPGFSQAEVNMKESIQFESLTDKMLIIKETDDQYDAVDNALEPQKQIKEDEVDKKDDEEKKEEEEVDKKEDKEEEKEDEVDKKEDKEEEKEDEVDKKDDEEEEVKEENIKIENKNILKNNNMKKLSLAEIILAKKNGTQINENVQEVLNETKKSLHDATNIAIEGMAIPFNLLVEDDPVPTTEPILSPETANDDDDNVGALNATITDINGKTTIHTEYQEMLAPIFANNVLSAFDLMTGLRGNVEIPRYGGVSAYWKGELKKAGESTMKFDSIEVKPKRLTVFVDLSNQLLMQSAYNVENYVRTEMINAISRKLQSTILGAGAGDDVTPAGLFYDADTLTGGVTYANLVDIEKDAEEQNVRNGLGYIINPEIKAAARTTLKSNVAGAQYLYENGELIGMPTWVTTDAAGLLYGDLKQVLICVWGNGIDMKVDTTTLAQYDATRLVINFYVDVVNRAPLTGEAEDATPVKNIFPFVLGE